MALSLDDEIHIHLNQGHPPSFIAEWIYEKMISSDYEWSDANMNTFCLFILKAGRCDLILYFFQKFYKDEALKIEPAFLIWAIVKSFPLVSKELQKIIYAYFNEDEKRWVEAALTKFGDPYWPELRERRKRLRDLNTQKLNKLRKDLIQKFELFSSQNLNEPAKNTIRKLEKIFPGDLEIFKITMKFKERDAESVFDKYRHKKSRLDLKPKVDPDVMLAQQGLGRFLKRELNKMKGFEADLVILCLTLEMNELALELFHSPEVINENVWLYLEVLLLNRRNLEILSLLPSIEKNFSHLPDTFLACTFMRSQALWNLGERNTAIEVLQAVVEVKPNYRSSDVLLAEWSRS
ncbi:MAG: hypothetical protein JNL11_18690 [Bdellovibrionaceae bacterium]|nr:hypothetical protein [Pseudobdellovibrionaceae bacterium]